MSSRRRVGVSAATTEAARRQLMQPVPCWEKVWVTPEVNSTMKVFKWVKTDKIQQFNDDENGVDEPLAPLPDADDVEVIDGDEDDEKDENGVVATQEAEPLAAHPQNQEDEESKAAAEPEQEEEPTQLTLPSADPDVDLTGIADDGISDGTGGLMDSTTVAFSLGDDGSILDTSGIAGLDNTSGVDMSGLDVSATLDAVDVTMDSALSLGEDGGMEIDMTSFGPDGLGLESAHDLSQMQPDDTIMGGAMMDQTVDPFADPEAQDS